MKRNRREVKTILAATANTVLLPGIGTLLQKRWKEGSIQSGISLLTALLLGTALGTTIQTTKMPTEDIKPLLIPAATSLLGLILLIGNWAWSLSTSKSKN